MSPVRSISSTLYDCRTYFFISDGLLSFSLRLFLEVGVSTCCPSPTEASRPTNLGKATVSSELMFDSLEPNRPDRLPISHSREGSLRGARRQKQLAVSSAEVIFISLSSPFYSSLTSLEFAAQLTGVPSNKWRPSLRAPHKKSTRNPDRPKCIERSVCR